MRHVLIRWLLVLIIFVAVACGGVMGRSWWQTRQIEDLKRRCQVARSEERWNDLESISAQWIERQPDSGEALVTSAIASQELGDLSKTAAMLERVPDEFSGAIPSLIDLSGLYFEPLRRPVKGVQTCERILSIDPKIVVAHERLCHYFAMTLQRNRLLNQLKESIRLRAETVNAYSYFVTMPDLVFSDAIDRVNEWLEVTPDDPSLAVARALLRARDDSLKSGNQYEDEVLQQLHSLHAKYPNDLEVLITLLEIISRNGDSDQVEILLERAPKDAGNDCRFWRIRSWYSLAVGDLETAEKEAKECLRLQPMDWHNWQHLGGILRQRSKPEEAAEAQRIAMFGKELQGVLIGLPDPKNPPRAALEGILEFSQSCGDEFVESHLSKRLGISRK